MLGAQVQQNLQGRRRDRFVNTFYQHKLLKVLIPVQGIIVYWQSTILKYIQIVFARDFVNLRS